MSKATYNINKIKLYIISLWLLFFLIIIITIDIPICFSGSCTFIGIIQLIKLNVIPLVSFIMVVLGILFYSGFKYTLNGSLKNPTTVSNVENINFEHLTFLTTYIIPLICFDLSSIKYATVMLILLVIIGVIYVKTDLFYSNPSLAILGYHIYRVEANFDSKESSSVIIISRDKIISGDMIQHIALDDKIYYARRVK